MTSFKNGSYQTDHPQVRAYEPLSGMFAVVDEGMAHLLTGMWRLGLKTQYSCQQVDAGDGLAYVVLNQSSAREFEKMLRKADLSPEARITANMFLNGRRLYDLCISGRRREYARVIYRKRFVRDIPTDTGFLVERLYQNAPHWLRTTYRWYPHWTPRIEKLLGELIEHQEG